MAWDSNGTVIVQGCKTSTQRRFSGGVWRVRRTTYERTLWTSLDQASAKDLQAKLALDPDYSESDATRADESDQWHVSALKRTTGPWENEEPET